MPPLSSTAHTEYVDNFVCLAQQESVVGDAAERVFDALVEVGLPVHPVTCSSGGETSGLEFDPVRPVVGVSRRGLWRFRVAMLYVLG